MVRLLAGTQEFLERELGVSAEADAPALSR
jgi:hypothetical protein